MVFISGDGSTSAAWRFVQPEIEKTTRTCAYDRAGFAWSDLSKESQTMARSAGDLHVLLGKLGARPPYVLVPHSLGGAIAMQFAADHPEEIAGFVFVDAAYAELYEAFLERFPEWRKRLRRTGILLRVAHVAAVLGLLRVARVKMANKKLPKDEADPINAFVLTPRFFAAMRSEMAGLLASRDEPRADPPVDRPAVVLTHGNPHALFKQDAGEQLWIQMQQQLARRFAGADVRVVEGAGHFIQLDQPDAVIVAIEDVLRAVRR